MILTSRSLECTVKNKKDIPISIGNFALINWSREKMKIGEDACYVIPEEYKDISGCVYCYVREREALFFEEPNPYKEIEPGKTILANIADVFVPGKLRLVKDIKYIDTDCELLELSNGQIKGIFSFCVSERDY